MAKNTKEQDFLLLIGMVYNLLEEEIDDYEQKQYDYDNGYTDDEFEVEFEELSDPKTAIEEHIRSTITNLEELIDKIQNTTMVKLRKETGND